MKNRKLKILVLEPYFGGSHKSILDGLLEHSAHHFTILEMPARKWKWRMRGAAIEFAERAGALAGRFDLVFANDMMSVADWRALAPAPVAALPVVTYFHENQLTYPVRDESERDYQYGFTNVTTCLASDEVWFNSAFHRDEFLQAADALLKRMPDCVPKGVTSRIAGKARVVHPGVEAASSASLERSRPYTILWNHRWEWDKNPEEFFDAVTELVRSGRDFRLAVAGESFREAPEVFAGARSELADIAINFGHVESRSEYLELLGRCDIAVSTAFHEFFGLSVVEAAAAGCMPVVPRRLSYPEIFDVDANRELFYEEGTLAAALEALLDGDRLPGRQDVRRLVGRYLWRERIGEWDLAFAEAADRAAL